MHLVTKPLPEIEIRANRHLIGQAVINLIDNAIDASPKEGEIVIRAMRHPRDDRCVRIEVEDHGEGVPESIREHLFDPFTTTKPQGQGTGLGLDISYRIVTDRHGGRIHFESEPGCTVFRIDLPIRGTTESGPTTDGAENGHAPNGRDS